jgi:DNA-binding response OmpR family regulator
MTGKPEGGPKRKVVVCEDEPAIAQGVRDNLELEGYQVFVAQTS